MNAQSVARWVLAGMILVALLLRAPITGVPPVLGAISETLSLTPTQAGLASTLPLLCFGVFAFLAPLLSARVGIEPTLWIAVILLDIGMGVRLIVGAPAFFGGTLLIGLGVAVGNVVVPALARAWFAGRLVLAMALYSVALQISGAAGPLATAIGVGSGIGWPLVIGLWLIPGLVALGLWGIASLKVRTLTHGRPQHAPKPTGLGRIAQKPRSWVITAVMGMQSLLFYALLTWLPAQFRSHGATEAQSGLLLTLFTVLGLLGSWLTRRFTTDPAAPRNLVLLFTGYAAGFWLLWCDRPGTVLAGAVICGVCQGLCLAIALTFIAHQQNAADVPAMSALAQGVGYVIAAVGPVLLGLLYARTGSFRSGEAVLIAIALAVGVCSIHIARSIRSEHDEVAL